LEIRWALVDDKAERLLDTLHHQYLTDNAVMNYSFFLTCISLRKVKQPIPSINKVINNHIKVDLHMSVYMHISYKLDSRSSPIVDLK
jgi:hypothetical protein